MDVSFPQPPARFTIVADDGLRLLLLVGRCQKDAVGNDGRRGVSPSGNSRLPNDVLVFIPLDGRAFANGYIQALIEAVTKQREVAGRPRGTIRDWMPASLSAPR